MSVKKYRRMRVDLFNHDKTRGLGAVAKLLMLYLTTPHHSGIACRSIAQMRNGIDVGLSVGAVRDALAELVAAGVVQWDEDFEVVWVIEAFDEQVCSESERHPNMAKSVMAHIDTLPPSSVVRAFLERYGAWLRRSGVQMAGDGQPALRVIDSGGGKSTEAADAGAGETDGRAVDDLSWLDELDEADPHRDPPSNPSRKAFGNPLPDPSVDPFFDPFGNQVTGNREQVTESREQVVVDPRDCGSSRQSREVRRPDDDDRAKPTDARGSPGVVEYRDAERAISRAFDAAMGLAVGPGAYQYAMERWQAEDATVEEILRVVDWWRANRDDAACQLRECFMRRGNGARWPRVEALALGRSPAAKRAGGGRGGHGARRPSIDETRAAYQRHTAKKSTA